MRWVLIVCVACGDHVQEPATHGGDRLEIYWFEMEGGGREPELRTRATGAVGPRLFDRERQEDCDAIEWSDGTLRCTPGFADNEWRAPVFADATCTQMRGLSFGPRDYFLRHEMIDRRLVASALYPGGTRVDTEEAYYVLSGGDCRGPFPLRTRVDNGDLWTLGPEVSSSALVELDMTTLASSTRIGREALAGADGTQVLLGFYDQELETPCSLVYGERDVRCIPTEAVDPFGHHGERWFADDECTAPLSLFSRTERFMVERFDDADGCSTVWKLGPRTMMPIFELVGNVCRPMGSGMARAGTRIVAPTVELSLGIAPSRVVDRLAAGTAIGVFDTATQAACSVYSGNDTSLCLPSAGSVDKMFSDVTCSQPLEVTLQSVGKCRRASRFARLDPDTFAEVGQRIEHVFTNTDGSCGVAPKPDTCAFHTLGPLISTDAFPSATSVHAP